MYYVLLPDLATRSRVIERLKVRGVQTVFHYIPLHSSPIGKELGRAASDMRHTDATGERLLRLPLWVGLEDQLAEVIAEIVAAIEQG
jgi:dTDP-4-amino-4,6-dideoxygalactose transaminase